MIRPALRLFISLALLILNGGCVHQLARRLVLAPNREFPAAQKADAPESELKRLYVDQQLRIAVGPPDASLSVWITQPYRGPESLKLIKINGRVRAELHRTPSTQPTAEESPKATVFLLHGINDEKSMGSYIMYREMLVRHGYRVVQPDLRGHGRSSGKYITYGVVESRDLVQVLDQLEQRGLVASPVGIVAISYGAATGIQWAAIDPRVRAIVALEPFCTMRAAIHDVAPYKLRSRKWMFSDRDITRAVDQGGHIAGFNPDDASPLRAIGLTKTPVLLVHSRADEFISYTHSQRLHDAAADHSKLILVEGQSHFDLWLKSFDLIQEQTLEWFDKYLNSNEVTAKLNH